MPMDVEVLV